MGMSPVQRARIAALTRWSREDPKPAMERVRKGLATRFENEVDPERKLSPAERRRRAEAAKRAHMMRMAAKSAEARKR